MPTIEHPIYKQAFQVIDTADDIGGCADTAEYIELMQAIAAECNRRIDTARANYYAQGGAFANEMPPLAGDADLLPAVLEMLCDAQGAILRFHVPESLADAFDAAHDAGDIGFDHETDCYLHPDAVPLPDGSAGYYIPHQFQR